MNSVIETMYNAALFNEWAKNKEIDEFGEISHEPKYDEK